MRSGRESRWARCWHARSQVLTAITHRAGFQPRAAASPTGIRVRAQEERLPGWRAPRRGSPFTCRPHARPFDVSCGLGCLSPVGESVCLALGWYHSLCHIPTTTFATS